MNLLVYCCCYLEAHGTVSLKHRFTPAVFHRLSCPLVVANEKENLLEQFFTVSPAVYLFYSYLYLYLNLIVLKLSQKLWSMSSLFSIFLLVGNALIVLFSGDRFWLCQARKGPDLDTMWYTRISGSRDYSQQGE